MRSLQNEFSVVRYPRILSATQLDLSLLPKILSGTIPLMKFRKIVFVYAFSFIQPLRRLDTISAIPCSKCANLDTTKKIIESLCLVSTCRHLKACGNFETATLCFPSGRARLVSPKQIGRTVLLFYCPRQTLVGGAGCLQPTMRTPRKLDLSSPQILAHGLDL